MMNTRNQTNLAMASVPIPAVASTPTSSPGSSGSSAATLPGPILAGTSASGNQIVVQVVETKKAKIDILKECTYKEFKRVKDAILTAKANGETYDRVKIFQPLEENIGVCLEASGEWKPALNNSWNVFSDEELFIKLFRIFPPTDGLYDGNSDDSLYKRMQKRISNLRFFNIESVSKQNASFQKYLTEWNSITHDLGDTTTLTEEQKKSLIKDAMDSLTINRNGGVAYKTAKIANFVRLECPLELREFPMALYKALNSFKESISKAKSCGLINDDVENNANDRDKKRHNKHSDGHNRKKSKHHNNNNNNDNNSNHSNMNSASGGDRKECAACGRTGHTSDQCNFRKWHPDTNNDFSTRQGLVSQRIRTPSCGTILKW